MADFVFNVAKGRVAEIVSDGSDLVVVLLKAAEATDPLRDYNDLAALLGAAGNTEADFTNYARKTVANANTAVTVDDTANDVEVDITVDHVWDPAGGATNNTLTSMLICADGASDALRTPLVHLDLTSVTDGSTLTVSHGASGFYSAS